MPAKKKDTGLTVSQMNHMVKASPYMEAARRAAQIGTSPGAAVGAKTALKGVAPITAALNAVDAARLATSQSFRDQVVADTESAAEQGYFVSAAMGALNPVRTIYGVQKITEGLGNTTKALASSTEALAAAESQAERVRTGLLRRRVSPLQLRSMPQKQRSALLKDIRDGRR